MYGWLAAIILAGTTWGMGAWKDKQIDVLNEDIKTQTKTIATMEITALRSQQAISNCKLVNMANDAEREKAQAQAAEAIKRVAWYDAITKTRESQLLTQTQELRENATGECYKLDDALPADFVDWVFDTATEADN